MTKLLRLSVLVILLVIVLRVVLVAGQTPNMTMDDLTRELVNGSKSLLLNPLLYGLIIIAAGFGIFSFLKIMRSVRQHQKAKQQEARPTTPEPLQPPPQQRPIPIKRPRGNPADAFTRRRDSE